MTEEEQNRTSGLSREAQEEHLHLEAILQTMRQPLLVLDGALSVEHANGAFHRLFGIGEAETKGRKIYDLGDGQWNSAELRNLLEESLPNQGEVKDYRLEHDFTGTGRRVMIVNACRLQPEGRDDRILLSIDDVTEQELLRQQLEGQREYAEKIVDASRDALLILDRDFCVKTANETFYRVFRVDPSETVGRLVYDLANGQWNIPGLRGLLENVLLEDDTLDDVLVEHEFEELGRLTMMLSARRIDHMQLILLTIEDQTGARAADAALRETETRFRALVEATTYMIYRMSPDWREMWELDGRGVVQDAENQTADWLTDYVAPEDQTAVMSSIRTAIETKSPFQMEHRFRRSDGTVGWTFSRAVPLLDDAGEIVEWFGAATDVTERRQAVELLAHTQRLDAVGRLAGSIAHDFNNLLTVIIANIELAEMRSDEAARKSHLNKAMTAAQLGERLNNRLLVWAQQGPMRPQLLNLNDLITEIRPILDRPMGERIVLTLGLMDDLRPTFVDPAHIDSVILNLVVNAHEAMPDGGEIRLTTSNVTFGPEMAAEVPGARPGNYVCLTISDDGEGMSEEVQKRALEPFFSTKNHGTGVGLGLFSVQSIVHQSGGFLELDSQLGRGTTIRLFLPSDQSTDGGDALSAQAQKEPPATEGKVLVLVVEDRATVRDATRQRLETLGYRVIEAEDAKSALETLRANSDVRLVFSDVVMPGGLSGRDLARQIMSEYPDVAVLLTTGYSNEIAPSEKDDPTANVPVLVKPYRLRDLDRALNQVLELHSRISPTNPRRA